MLVDEDCVELARKFLEAEENEGYRHVLSEHNITALAECIQQSIEDFFADLD